MNRIIYFVIIMVAIFVIAICAFNIGNRNMLKSYEELEEKYGELEPYTPKATFVHFKTVDNYQIDCIKSKDGYQFLSKSKIKK